MILFVCLHFFCHSTISFILWMLNHSTGVKRSRISFFFSPLPDYVAMQWRIDATAVYLFFFHSFSLSVLCYWNTHTQMLACSFIKWKKNNNNYLGYYASVFIIFFHHCRSVHAMSYQAMQCCLGMDWFHSYLASQPLPLHSK